MVEKNSRKEILRCTRPVLSYSVTVATKAVTWDFLRAFAAPYAFVPEAVFRFNNFKHENNKKINKPSLLKSNDKMFTIFYLT